MSMSSENLILSRNVLVNKYEKLLDINMCWLFRFKLSLNVKNFTKLHNISVIWDSYTRRGN